MAAAARAQVAGRYGAPALRDALIAAYDPDEPARAQMPPPALARPA
jgi:hypothetical protein